MVDPNAVLATVLGNLVAQMQMPNGKSPLGILSAVTADVTRADPRVHDPLASADFAHISEEGVELFLDPTSGLERVYGILRDVARDP
jgi:hypothetical protein